MLAFEYLGRTDEARILAPLGRGVSNCGAGARADALALIALATNEKLSREQILKKAEELGININQPHLNQFLETQE
jgi:hypothetical protein